MYFIPYPYVAYYSPQWLGYHAQAPPLPYQDPFPPVNTKRLHSSAERFQKIMEEAGLLIDKLVSTPAFAKELMDAAQQSNQEKVDALITSAGITIKVKTIYNPTGIQFEFDHSEGGAGCCKLNMNLLW